MVGNTKGKTSEPKEEAQTPLVDSLMAISKPKLTEALNRIKSLKLQDKKNRTFNVFIKIIDQAIERKTKK